MFAILFSACLFVIPVRALAEKYGARNDSNFMVLSTIVVDTLVLLFGLVALFKDFLGLSVEGPLFLIASLLVTGVLFSLLLGINFKKGVLIAGGYRLAQFIIYVIFSTLGTAT